MVGGTGQADAQEGTALMLIAGFREGADQDYALVCSAEITRCLKWLAHELEEYGGFPERVEEIRILQNVGHMGISFNDLDEESGDLVSGFVMQATSLDA